MPNVNANAGNSISMALSAFSTSSFLASQTKKYNDLNEYATFILNSKLPKAMSKVKQINVDTVHSQKTHTHTHMFFFNIFFVAFILLDRLYISKFFDGDLIKT